MGRRGGRSRSRGRSSRAHHRAASSRHKRQARSQRRRGRRKEFGHHRHSSRSRAMFHLNRREPPANPYVVLDVHVFNPVVIAGDTVTGEVVLNIKDGNPSYEEQLWQYWRQKEEEENGAGGSSSTAPLALPVPPVRLHAMYLEWCGKERVCYGEEESGTGGTTTDTVLLQDILCIVGPPATSLWKRRHGQQEQQADAAAAFGPGAAPPPVPAPTEAEVVVPRPGCYRYPFALEVPEWAPATVPCIQDDDEEGSSGSSNRFGSIFYELKAKLYLATGGPFADVGVAAKPVVVLKKISRSLFDRYCQQPRRPRSFGPLPIQSRFLGCCCCCEWNSGGRIREVTMRPCPGAFSTAAAAATAAVIVGTTSTTSDRNIIDNSVSHQHSIEVSEYSQRSSRRAPPTPPQQPQTTLPYLYVEVTIDKRDILQLQQEGGGGKEERTAPTTTTTAAGTTTIICLSLYQVLTILPPPSSSSSYCGGGGGHGTAAGGNHRPESFLTSPNAWRIRKQIATTKEFPVDLDKAPSHPQQQQSNNNSNNNQTECTSPQSCISTITVGIPVPLSNAHYLPPTQQCHLTQITYEAEGYLLVDPPGGGGCFSVVQPCRFGPVPVRFVQIVETASSSYDPQPSASAASTMVLEDAPPVEHEEECKREEDEEVQQQLRERRASISKRRGSPPLQSLDLLELSQRRRYQEHNHVEDMLPSAMCAPIRGNVTFLEDEDVEDDEEEEVVVDVVAPVIAMRGQPSTAAAPHRPPQPLKTMVGDDTRMAPNEYMYVPPTWWASASSSTTTTAAAATTTHRAAAVCGSGTQQNVSTTTTTTNTTTAAYSVGSGGGGGYVPIVPLGTPPLPLHGALLQHHQQQGTVSGGGGGGAPPKGAGEDRVVIRNNKEDHDDAIVLQPAATTTITTEGTKVYTAAADDEDEYDHRTDSSVFGNASNGDVNTSAGSTATGLPSAAAEQQTTASLPGSFVLPRAPETRLPPKGVLECFQQQRTASPTEPISAATQAIRDEGEGDGGVVSGREEAAGRRAGRQGGPTSL